VPEVRGARGPHAGAARAGPALAQGAFRDRNVREDQTCPGVVDLVNLQNVDGKCKPYQVRQVLRLVDRYNLTLGDEA
jgi:hypothetical protein